MLDHVSCLRPVRAIKSKLKQALAVVPCCLLCRTVHAQLVNGFINGTLRTSKTISYRMLTSQSPHQDTKFRKRKETDA
jgi:hypothetical protein